MPYSIVVPLAKPEFFKKASNWLIANVGPRSTELVEGDTEDTSVMTGEGWVMNYNYNWDDMSCTTEFVMEDDSYAVMLALLARDWL